MGKGILITIVVLVIVLILAIFLLRDSSTTSQDVIPVDSIIIDSISGTLEDVSDSGATGTASAVWDGRYSLVASFQTIPDPEGTDFYEGWVVGPSVISTGKAQKVSDGVWENTYTSDENLLTHTRYVLTLEPDDGDPAPAAHVIEGTMN
jgi:hypothetical protein